MTYAGFWIRFLATMTDAFVIYLAFYLMLAVGGNPDAFASLFDQKDTVADGKLGLIINLTWLLYTVVLQGSPWQATVGKKILGLRVARESGGNITHLRALGRALAMIPSAIIFMIGYVIAGLHPRKRSLHDIIAGTVVVYGKPEPARIENTHTVPLTTDNQ